MGDAPLTGEGRRLAPGVDDRKLPYLPPFVLARQPVHHRSGEGTTPEQGQTLRSEGRIGKGLSGHHA